MKTGITNPCNGCGEDHDPEYCSEGDNMPHLEPYEIDESLIEELVEDNNTSKSDNRPYFKKAGLRI